VSVHDIPTSGTGSCAKASFDQRSFDDLGTPLHEVTFCVLDLETTGGSPQQCEITEVAAARFRGGECLGTLQTLVNPGCPIPIDITVLTGITETMVYPAPFIADVLPTLVEFIGDAVIVGHNIRFDLSFLNTALQRTERPTLANSSVDTCALARRLLRDEVPNCRLGTLASRLRLDHRPTHRALDDVHATADLLHLLLERAAGLGVMGLDDLLSLPKMGGHPQAQKLSMTAKLPRAPGVYLFRDRRGQVLYVGKAANLRARVRSYFSTDSRRKVGALLREAAAVDHEVCANQLEAAVREVRLIHEHVPRYNRHAKDWHKYCWVKLTLQERSPRLAVARVARDDGALYLGPLSSARVAKRVIDAIQTACPCSGERSTEAHAAIVDQVRRGLTHEPDLLFAPLVTRLDELSRAERYEEAADLRDRAEALAGALRRQRSLAQLRAVEAVVIECGDNDRTLIRRGRLATTWGTDGRPTLFDQLDPDDLGSSDDVAGPVPKDLVDELLVVASFLDRRAPRLRLVSCEGELVSQIPRLPSFEPRARVTSTRPRRATDR